MNDKIYNYKKAEHISNTTIFPTIGLFIFGVGCLFTSGYLYLGIASLILVVIIFTTHQVLEVNVSTKTFKHYRWILGYKQAQSQPYDLIEYAFIQSGSVRRTYNSLAGSNTITKPVYNGYIKFSENAKIHLVQATDKEVVIKKLRGVATDLNLEIMDFTEADGISIFPGSTDELPAKTATTV